MSKQPETQTDYVPVYAAAGMVEANLIQSVLEAAGISVLVYAESAGAVFGVTFGEMGRVDLWVPRDRRAEAEEIIARLHAPAEDEGAGGELSPE